MQKGNNLKLPSNITFGSDCSGIEAPIQALNILGISVDHKFSSEKDDHARRSIEANYHPDIIYPDIQDRNHSDLPHVDLYVCGFPCQPFSNLGKHGGFYDPRGTIFFECLETIKHTKPKIFVLENVKGLITNNGGKTFDTIKYYLDQLTDYNIDIDVYNTLDYGLPQNRERVYFVGLHKKYCKKPYRKPKPIPLEITVTHLVDADVDDQKYFNTTEHKLNIIDGLIKAGKIDSIDEPWCVNLNVSGPNRTTPMKNISPCLLAGNGGNCTYHLTSLRRKLTPREYLRLQGFSETFKQTVSDSKMYKQAGNTMSVNVLCFILVEIFKSTKLD